MKLMTFKQKLNKIIFIIVFCVTMFCSCADKNGYSELNYDSIPSQKWFDKYICHSIVTDSTGHTLILHEYGSRANGYGSYSFSIEHSPECKKCCEIYD